MKNLIRQTMNVARLWWAYMLDFAGYARYSLGGLSFSCRDERLRGQMMLLLHALEKGMSLAHKKQGWGAQKGLALCKAVEEYAKRNGADEYLSLAVSVLVRYREDACASKDVRLTDKIDTLASSFAGQLLPQGSAGVLINVTPPIFDRRQIEEFFESRHSVRDFSDDEITDEEISEAMRIAGMTPTACNRQSSKVYAFREKGIRDRIIDLQLGDQGWCDNASVLFLITGNMSFFGGVAEREQVYIDGGLFAMNFVWGLHLAHVASCFKMFVRNHALQRKLRKLLDIPKNEVPIVLILAGHYRKEPSLRPASYRFSRPCVDYDAEHNIQGKDSGMKSV